MYNTHEVSFLMISERSELLTFEELEHKQFYLMLSLDGDAEAVVMRTRSNGNRIPKLVEVGGEFRCWFDVSLARRFKAFENKDKIDIKFNTQQQDNMKTISVFGSIRQKIDVNPIDVINKLVEQAIDDDAYVVEKDGNYFLKYSSRRGWGAATEITKELYEYVTSLQKVREYLTKHQK